MTENIPSARSRALLLRRQSSEESSRDLQIVGPKSNARLRNSAPIAFPAASSCWTASNRRASRDEPSSNRASALSQERRRGVELIRRCGRQTKFIAGELHRLHDTGGNEVAARCLRWQRREVLEHWIGHGALLSKFAGFYAAVDRWIIARRATRTPKPCCAIRTAASMTVIAARARAHGSIAGSTK